MIEEIKAIEKNNTSKLVELPDKKKTIDVKWIFKVKFNLYGSVSKYKARLVARGFLQRYGVDYSEVFSPVARLETVRFVVALASSKNWSLSHLDVKSTFLNGPLEEDVYVTQPPGFEVNGKEQMMYKLHKALYGFKQAPRAWNKRIDQFLLQIGFKKRKAEYGIYVQNLNEENITMIFLYVDDLLVTGCNHNEIEKFIHIIRCEFEMYDLGRLSYFLGLELKANNTGIVMHQQKYIGELLDRFDMVDWNTATNPFETNAKLDECIINSNHINSKDPNKLKKTPNIIFRFEIINVINSNLKLFLIKSSENSITVIL